MIGFGQDGPFQDYYENGQLKLEGNFKNGKNDGLWKRYYENGQLHQEGYMKNGQYDGLWKHYHENGQLKYKCEYMINVEITAPECWDENGNRIDCYNVIFEK